MSLNIQTATGLLEIGGSVTKEKVISALGYEPADKTHTEDKTVHVTSAEKQTWNNKSDFSGAYADLIDAPNITENDSGNMVIADESGNIIMRVDADGLTTTNVNTETIKLNGEDLGVRLDELESMSLPNILDNGSDDLSIADEVGNVIVKINRDGFETTTVTAQNAVINGVDIGIKLDEHKESIDGVSGDLSTHTSDTDIHITATERETWSTSINQNTENISGLNTSLSSHTSNSTAHITADERTLWNNKSDFSGDYNDLTNAPDIKEDASGEVVYADESGNVIAKIGENGFETTQVIADAVLVEGTNVGAKLSGLDSTISSHTGNTDIHITVEERDAWNNRSDFSGSYNDLTDVPTDLATESYVDEKVANLVNSAPEALNTLDELAAALGDDSNFATTVTNSLAGKASKTALDTHTADSDIHITADERSAWDTKSDFSGNYNDLVDKPNVLDDESDEFNIADESGNIIFKVDVGGTRTTELILGTSDSAIIMSEKLASIDAEIESISAIPDEEIIALFSA